MFRVAVINFKNLVKNIIKILIVILLFLGIRNIVDFTSQSISKFDYKDILNKNIFWDLEKNDNNGKREDILDIAFLTSAKEKTFFGNNEILNVNNIENKKIEKDELSLIENETININEEKNQEINKEESNQVYEVNYEKVPTSVVSEHNITESYNVIYDTVKIKNESKYSLSNEMMTPNIEFIDKTNVLIFHTHTCESYTPTEQNSYVASGNFRTIDMNYSVARVGSELTNYLSTKGFNVTHLKDTHDYPAYNGSYTRSYNTVNSVLSLNKSTQLVIDLHRDAVGSKSDYAPSVMIGDEKVAQLMFVIGTNGGGMSHDNWNMNLKLAIKIQQKANEMYPGLFRPIVVRNSRYNQNLADGACIIEVGATGNTLEESIGSMKYLSNVLEATMK